MAQPVIRTTAIDSGNVKIYPNRNQSGRRWVMLNDDPANQAHYLVHFPKPFKRGAVIVSATLRLTPRGTWSGNRSYVCRRITEKWQHSKVTWNKTPNVTLLHAATGNMPSGSSAPVAFDVTAMMQDVSGGAEWWGFRIDASNFSPSIFWTSEAADDNVPTLELEWADNPAEPTGLSPAGQRYVSVSKPTLTWDFVDVSGDTDMGGYQVQINGTNSWSSPQFDTGWVSATEPQLDLSLTSFGGVSNLDGKWWRVRQRDGSGLPSTWSDPVMWRRQNKGTVTITNPGVAPNNYVEEPTPPITWTFTGNQKAYRVRLILLENGNEIYNSGKHGGNDTAHTIPSGYLGIDDWSYRVTVDIWDDVDREATPGDPQYVRASREFTFQRSASVTHVTSLSATPQNPRPNMLLQWDRATAPDYFLVFRDDHFVQVDGEDIRLFPEDCFVSGTTYQYMDTSASPKKEHTWAILPVVNGKTANASAPTVKGWVERQGIWLIDRARNLEVAIGGMDEVSFDMGERGENYDVLGSDKKIRITQSLQGYEGDVSGILINWNQMPNITADEWYNRLMKVKERPGRRVRLALSTMNIPIVPYNIVAEPMPDDETQYRVRFSFIQDGGLTFDARGF